MSKMKGKTVDKESCRIAEDELSWLRDRFPQVFSEGKIDWEKLHLFLDDAVDETPERYTFSWAGRRDAVRMLQISSHATLVPIKKDSVDFDETSNLFIEGDNLEVMKLLYKSYYKQVKLIYIDPPYNTGKDFVYPDDFREPLAPYLKISKQSDEKGNLLTSNPETSGRYHSRWLSMMYPRLFIARQLLRDDGVIFISIDDNEVYNLRQVMNEIFGEENFIASIVWQKKQSPQNDETNISAMHDYILVYAKQAKMKKSDEKGWERQLLTRDETQEQRYSNPDNDPRGAWTSVDYTCNKTAEERPNLYYPIKNPFTKEDVWPSKQRVWRFEKRTHLKNKRENRIWWGDEGKSFPRLKRFRSEVQQGIVPSTWWDRKFAGDNQRARRELRSFFPDLEDAFDTPKPVQLIKRIIEIGTKPNSNDIVLDFFAGSGTTAQSVLESNQGDEGNRSFILIQLPEPMRSEKVLKDGTILNTISDVCRERIKRVINKMGENTQTKLLNTLKLDLGFRYFKLSDSNFNQWTGTSQYLIKDYIKTLEKSVNPIKENSNDNDIIYETIIKEGFKLTSKIEQLGVTKKYTIYRVINPDGTQFMICLDEELDLDTIKKLDLKKNQTFICRDSALDDSMAANLALQCRLKTL